MKNRSSMTALMLLSLLLIFSAQVYAQTPVLPQTESKVILYDNPNFGEPSRSFGIGTHTLFSAADFHDRASSIKVPADLVVIVSEHADAGGGYGLWVDFLEDQPNLADHNLDNKISHLKIIPRRRSGAVWVRNRTLSGKFQAGHYEVVGRGGGGGGALNPTPLVVKKGANIRQPQDPRPEPSTSTPPRPPPPPVFCSLTGQVKNYSSIYASTFTLFLYRSDGSRTQFSTKITGGQYTIRNVPEGTYELRGGGYYERTGQIITADGSQRVTCEGGRSNSITFKIGPGEG